MMDEPDLIGDWHRERVLGSGAFGIVTLWKNSITSDKIAIKKCRGDLGSTLTPKQKERWTKEVEMMQRINNENIVSFRKLPLVFDRELQKFNESNLPMLSMEYCTEGDLRSILSRAENCCGLPESDVRYILSDLMNAVSYLHTLKITHRDLKPENVVLQTCDRKNKIIYKLIDLGYAKEIDASSVAASFVGTLQYLAPEIFIAKTYSCSVDYWSLGLVAFEVICGVRPFLPNMSPAQWMRYVQQKNSEVICIYQKENEEIEYSKEIFLESHISSCFKREIEKWLQLSLEYNPKKRGHINYDPKKSDNELLIFKALENALKKRIITVFSVFTYKFLSYEIDDFTLITTLQGWIERDTKISISEQFLLSTYCESIKLEGLALQCFDQTYTTDPMLYVFKTSAILKEDVVPEIPVLVQSMLENTTMLPYYIQKMSYGHSLYFIFKENKLYNSVLDACNLRIKYLLQLFNETRDKYNTMTLNIQILVAEKNFCKNVLDFDVKQYLKHFSQDASHWVKSYTLVATEIEKLHELSKRLVVRYESIYRRINNIVNISEKEYSKYLNHDLNVMLNEALDVYKKLKSKSRNDRCKPESCVNMVKVLYNVLKHRDKLLKKILFIQFQRQILDIDLELTKVILPINTALQHIEKIKLDLLNDQILRQTKIWEFTIKQKSKPKVLEQDEAVKQNNKDECKPNFIIGDVSNINHDKQTVSEKSLQLSLDKTGDIDSNVWNSAHVNQIQETINKRTLNTDNKYNTDSIKAISQNCKNISIKENVNSSDVKIVPNFQIGAPASLIINDNQILRYELQEKTSESFLKCKSILNEDLDFSFLDNV